MNYKVKTIPNFNKSLKRLAKKYASLKQEYITLLDSLEVDPQQGIRLDIIAIKYALPLRLKIRVRAVVQG